MRHLKRSDETIDFSEFLSELLTEEEVKAVLGQELLSTVNDVPASSQMASSYLSPAVQGNVHSAPTQGEDIVNDLITSSQTLPSIDELFDLASQIASTPGDDSSIYDSAPDTHISTPSTPAPPGDANLGFDTTSSDPFPVLHISAPPSLTAPGDTIINSSEHDSVPSTPSALGDAQINYQTTSSQSFQILCNMVNSVPSTSQAQCFDQLSGMQPSTSSYNVAPRAPDPATINHQISLEQPSLAVYNVPAPGSADINHQTSFGQPSLAPNNEAPRAPDPATINYQISLEQPSLAVYNVPAPGSADINNQTSFGKPSLAPNNVAPDPATINHQISLEQPSLAVYNVPAPVSADINNQTSFGQPSLAPNNVAPPAPGCTSITPQMSFKQLSPDNYNVAQPAPGSANFNYQMSFSQHSPVRYIVVPSAPRSAAVNQLTSFRPLLPALHNASPGCDSSSQQMNACHPLPALKKSIHSAKEKTPAPKRRCVRISKPALVILNKWFDSHIEHPYPDKRAVEMLTSTCNITATQVKKWCCNRRKKGRKQLEAQIPTSPATSDSKDSVDEHAV